MTLIYAQYRQNQKLEHVPESIETVKNNYPS